MKRLLTPLALFALVACGDSGPTVVNATADAGGATDAAGGDTGVGADAAADVPAPEPDVPEFGFEETRTFTLIATVEDGLNEPRDLEFNPAREGELWIANRADDTMTIVFDAGVNGQSSQTRYDAFANHFLEETAAIAFAPNGFWGSCGETRNTYDGQAPANDFMGPALWTSDLDVFARAFQDPFGSDLGSHMDMLHQSPNCMGMAHDTDNAYWVFDGLNGHLVYYDFQADHGPGQDDHSDGIVRRYPEVELTYVANTPGHMELDHETGILYIADPANRRVIWVDTDTGEFARDLVAFNEPLEEYSEYLGVEWGAFVDVGLDTPSGIALTDERLFVGDVGSGEIIAYDLDGQELGRMSAGTESIGGLTIGPDGKLWFADSGFDEVFRIDP